MSAATGSFSGSLNAAGGTFAGALSAATGTFNGALSAASGTFSGNLLAAGGTFNGALSAATGTFAGALSAASGTFAGNLSAAGGSFKGDISAATGSFSGTLNAAGGTFAGSLSAATGSFRGSLSAATGTFAGDISAATGTFAGAVRGGAFTSYAFPPSGQTGFYLSSQGLLIGNINDNRYVTIESNGNISAPGFSVTNGVMTISQVNVINTLNVASEAITSIRYAQADNEVSIAIGQRYEVLRCAAINIPASSNNGVLIVYAMETGPAYANDGATPELSPDIYLYRDSVLIQHAVSSVNRSFQDNPPLGSSPIYTLAVQITNTTGFPSQRYNNGSVYSRSITLLGVKR